MEYEYEDVDESGMPGQAAANEMEKKARLPKTGLQQLALQATGRTYFASAQQHKAFRKFEAMSAGADNESRMWFAWLKNRIEIAAKYIHSPAKGDRVDRLIASFGNEIKRDIWFSANRSTVLAKPSVGQLSSSMEERMQKLMEKKK